MSEKIPSDWRAIGITETQHYRIDHDDLDYIKDIVCVYFYDANEHTHLCEFTPSYFLRHLYTYIAYRNEDTMDEDVRSELDSKYCYEGNEDTYMHVSTVEGIAEKHPDLTAKWGHEEATEEEVREYWQGNCPL